jgi:hypothetical protein
MRRDGPGQFLLATNSTPPQFEAKTIEKRARLTSIGT